MKSTLTNHRQLLRYSSHLVSAPVIAAAVFVSLAVLESAQLTYALASVVFASVIPVAGIIYFARLGGFDYDVSERHARTRPFVVAIASYLAGFIPLVWTGAPVLLSGLMLAYSINTSVMFLVTLSWKISVHAAGVTGPLTFLVFKLGPPWGLLYLLVRPVGLNQT